MACEELLQLLKTDWRGNQSESSCVAAHIRSCSRCCYGLVQLTEALIASDALDCDQCRSRFPEYYEATRPNHPLVEVADAELIEVAFHLSRCANCREEYEMLVLISELEERNETVDEK